MSFKSQFSASQDKAHNRNIATKIHEEMAKLRAGVDASPTTPRRWVWELIQNAKDVNIDGKVRVRIEADLDGSDAHVTFKHNGGAFSPENIRFLIEQVSSKEEMPRFRTGPGKTGRPGLSGGPAKRSHGGIVNPSCNRKGKCGNPAPTAGARGFYPNQGERRSTSHVPDSDREGRVPGIGRRAESSTGK